MLIVLLFRENSHIILSAKALASFPAATAKSEPLEAKMIPRELLMRMFGVIMLSLASRKTASRFPP